MILHSILLRKLLDAFSFSIDERKNDIVVSVVIAMIKGPSYLGKSSAGHNYTFLYLLQLLIVMFFVQRYFSGLIGDLCEQ